MNNLRLMIIVIACAMLFLACKSTETKTDASMSAAQEQASATMAAPAIKSARLTVPGADCASTGAAAELLIGKIKGVKSAMVDIDSTTADITYDPSVVSLEDIKAAMQDTEYPVSAAEELK